MTSETLQPRKETAEFMEISTAIIEKEGKYLITLRHPEKFMGGKWEFPGGKLESGETPEQALRREIREELGGEVKLEIVEALPTIEFDYNDPTGKVYRLYNFRCRIGGGVINLKADEITELRWVTIQELKELDLLETDKKLLPLLETNGK